MTTDRRLNRLLATFFVTVGVLGTPMAAIGMLVLVDNLGHEPFGTVFTLSAGMLVWGYSLFFGYCRYLRGTHTNTVSLWTQTVAYNLGLALLTLAWALSTDDIHAACALWPTFLTLLGAVATGRERDALKWVTPRATTR